MQNILQMIREDAKNLHLLIAEDDLVMQALYKRLFEGVFAKMTITQNGQEAYEYFLSQEKHKVDLIITDNYMPKMTGMELVQKVRVKDFNVRILVMTSETDYNNLKAYMLSGVDAILPKPYDEELTMHVLQRTLHQINEKKLLEVYVEQLETMAKENIVRRNEERKKKIQEPIRETPKTVTLVDKYKIRSSVQDMENVNVDDLDTFGRERIDYFRESIADYESSLCAIEPNDIVGFREALMHVLGGMRDLIKALDVLGAFPIATNAAVHLIYFVEDLEESEFYNKEKKDLFIDILLSMLGDFDKWIETVFITKTAKNIHYFDASFANTCLELEMIFKTELPSQDEDTLEFF